MSRFSNLVNALFYNGKSITKNEYYGGWDAMTPKQNDLNYPFEEAFIKSSDVYSIVSKITKNARNIPILLKKTVGDETEIITEGEIYNLVNHPNEKQGLSEFTELSLMQLLLGGNVYLNPVKPIGFSKASKVYLLHPQYVQINSEFISMWNEIKNFEYHINGKKYTLLPEEIEHLKYANPTNYGFDTNYGLSPLVAGYLTSQGLISNDTASANIVKNQGVSAIISNESGNVLNPEQQKLQQRLLDNKLEGAEKFGKRIQSAAKVSVHQLGMSPTQLKIIETKTLKMRDLANIYDVPSEILGDPASKIYNSVTQAEKSFFSKAVLTNLNLFIEAYEKVTTKPYDTDREKYALCVDTSGIESLQADQKTEAEKDKIVMEGISIVLNMPIESSGKIALLVNQYDFSEEEAKAIVS